jgi:hypothetical protein
MQMKTLVRGVLLTAALLSASCGGALDDASPVESQPPAEDAMLSQGQRVYECSDGDYTVICRDDQTCCYRGSGFPPYCTRAQCP